MKCLYSAAELEKWKNGISERLIQYDKQRMSLEAALKQGVMPNTPNVSKESWPTTTQVKPDNIKIKTVVTNIRSSEIKKSSPPSTTVERRRSEKDGDNNDPVDHIYSSIDEKKKRDDVTNANSHSQALKVEQ